MIKNIKLTPNTKRIKPYRRWVNVNVPLWLLRREEISAGAKLLYGRLLMFMGNKIYCYPSQNKLAEELATSIRTVNRHIKELKINDLIEVEQKGRNKTAKYYILSHEWETDLRKNY